MDRAGQQNILFFLYHVYGSTYLAYVAVGRGDVGVRDEREAVVLAGEAVGGVHVAVAARAEGGLVGAAEQARLGRLAGGAEHLHGGPAAAATMHRLNSQRRRRLGSAETWKGSLAA